MSRIVHNGIRSGAPRESCPGSDVDGPISSAQKCRTTPPVRVNTFKRGKVVAGGIFGRVIAIERVAARRIQPQMPPAALLLERDKPVDRRAADHREGDALQDIGHLGRFPVIHRSVVANDSSRGKRTSTCDPLLPLDRRYLNGSFSCGADSRKSRSEGGTSDAPAWALHSYLYSDCDDDGDGEDPQLDGGEAGVSNLFHRLPLLMTRSPNFIGHSRPASTWLWPSSMSNKSTACTSADGETSARGRGRRAVLGRGLRLATGGRRVPPLADRSVKKSRRKPASKQVPFFPGVRR
ncbi:hypothetical protein OKW39_006497 [Paraburkholderia sp. MM6662-R1]